ncbi:MAG: hypothetical protein OEW21_13820 [Betaproteobacteria bacterium]|nr:hypothetical protein [Betaproteobacteria bacterium]
MATKKKPARRRKTAAQPFWERGYNGHAYWLGKTKLGKVTLHSAAHSKHKYTWEAAGKVGASDDLAKARRAVELAVAMADRQLDLFS